MNFRPFNLWHTPHFFVLQVEKVIKIYQPCMTPVVCYPMQVCPPVTAPVVPEPASLGANWMKSTRSSESTTLPIAQLATG